MDLKEITDRNYEATKRRGLITDKTKFSDFKWKLLEELNEWTNCPEDPYESADIILVILAFCKHFHINIQKALEEKTIFNEQRND